MSYGVFIHRADSIYDDRPAERYQFPKRYLSQVQSLVGCWIIYLEPRRAKRPRGYFAVAKVKAVECDLRSEDMYQATMEPGSYCEFSSPVPFSSDAGVIESGILNESGQVSGRRQSAVRALPAVDFTTIFNAGFFVAELDLPRADELVPSKGMFEEGQPFVHDFGNADVRPRETVLIERAFRDRNFRKLVVGAYDKRCAVTGLRLINGGGRAEVEAAHIRPVSQDGPDMINNGIALSGTVHWMFDRGLIGIADDNQTILVSRQANDPDSIKAMINPSGLLLTPANERQQPYPAFVNWHRENCYKH